MLRVIHSYLRQRTFKVKLEGQRSTVRAITAKEPQTSAFSLLLFSTYKSDMPTTAYVNLAGCPDNQPPSPNIPQHFTNLIHKVEPSIQGKARPL
ncbi:hypothetical protein Trydic_g619 [Trypoxylus dichotomus]